MELATTMGGSSMASFLSRADEDNLGWVYYRGEGVEQDLEEAVRWFPPSGRWLLDARDDEERFRRLQIYAGGTDQQMWQIGYRYEEVYRAIANKDWELGTHHWGKLRNVFNVALMKRPNRTPNAEALFLDDKWQLLATALEAQDLAMARETFLQERQACHAASRERVWWCPPRRERSGRSEHCWLRTDPV